MSTAVTPIEDLARRIPIVAKLRHGVFKGGRPQAIDTWRLTTSSRPFADEFADLYGGQVESMNAKNSPHNWEVISEVDEVAITLIPDGHDRGYELWSAQGRQRSCDGVTASVLRTTGPDDVEYVEGPCICDRKGVLECKIKTRLTFVLPDLTFRGGVVYETGSKNFAQESKGMVDLLERMRAQGVHRGVLRLEERRSSGNRRYTIATVGIDQSLDALAAGTARRGIAPVPERPELDGGEEAPRTGGGGDVERHNGDDPGVSVNGDAASEGAGKVPSDTEDIVEAEVVEEQKRLSDWDEAKLRATFMAIVHGDICDLGYKSQVQPFLKATFGASWSGMDIEDQRKLVRLVTRGDTRSQKEAAQKEFREKVLAFHGEGEA